MLFMHSQLGFWRKSSSEWWCWATNPWANGTRFFSLKCFFCFSPFKTENRHGKIVHCSIGNASKWWIFPILMLVFWRGYLAPKPDLLAPTSNHYELQGRFFFSLLGRYPVSFSEKRGHGGSEDWWKLAVFGWNICFDRLLVTKDLVDFLDKIMGKSII